MSPLSNNQKLEEKNMKTNLLLSTLSAYSTASYTDMILLCTTAEWHKLNTLMHALRLHNTKIVQYRIKIS